jgi:Putative zinc-finger
MNCHKARRLLPGYLDGGVGEREHVALRAHLESCGRCRAELERYRLLATRLANVEPVAVPEGLALQIRLTASRERTLKSVITRMWSRVVLVSENILKPMAVPAFGGVLTAFAVFVLLVQTMLVGMPLGGVVPNDSPLNLVEPAHLESLSPFPMSGIADANSRSESGGLLLDATVSAHGEVLFYKILSGPNSAQVQREIDQVLLFSRFRPQTKFGRPTDGGHVLLNFNEVRVRG